MDREYDKSAHKGLLVIGDPHLEARVPGFRKDNYPHVILEKLRWSLDYARTESLLPVILGDLFHLPRSNPNWLLVAVMEQFDIEILGIYGNHDVHENALTDDDSIRVIERAGRIRLIDGIPHQADINGRPVLIGGTPWGQRLPEKYEPDPQTNLPPLVIWLAHHDVMVPGYEDQGRIRPKELPGIDLVINGHIHGCLGEIHKGRTCWLTPGNISRRARSDATRLHRPAVLRLDISQTNWSYQYIEIPHQPFDQVFHEAVADTEADDDTGSAFVTGLAEMQARRTQTGEGLMHFLEKNLDQFESDVVREIKQLAYEVTQNDGSENGQADD